MRARASSSFDCIRSGAFPIAWKYGYVTPVFKSGNVNIIVSITIAILSNFAKVFETAIYSKIFERVFSRLHQAQHGFVRRCSTSTNLICVTINKYIIIIYVWRT